jgi:hypothetical protein
MKKFMVAASAVLSVGLIGYWLANLKTARPESSKIERAEREREAAARDALMASGPVVKKFIRDGITVWTIEVPQQLGKGGYIFWEKCIAASVDPGKFALTCNDKKPALNADDLQASEDQPIDEMRGRK